MKFPSGLLMSAALILLSAVAVPFNAFAEDVSFHHAPPRPRVEEVPPPRAGFVWSPGYWDVRNNHHAWQQGHFERIRKGQRYEAPAWSQHEKHWELHYGRWSKNTGGSGIENQRVSAVSKP